MTLAPHEKREVMIQYQIEYPPTLVLETRRKHPAPDELPPPPGMPAAARPAPAHDLRKDLMNWEADF